MAVLGFLFTGITLSSFLLLMLASPGGEIPSALSAKSVPIFPQLPTAKKTAPLALPLPFAWKVWLDFAARRETLCSNNLLVDPLGILWGSVKTYYYYTLICDLGNQHPASYNSYFRVPSGCQASPFLRPRPHQWATPKFSRTASHKNGDFNHCNLKKKCCS